MTSPLATYTREGSIAFLSLNRPHRHNALVPDLLSALRDGLEKCRAEPPSVLILCAEGSSFSSGGDVGAFYSTEQSQRSEYASRVVGELNAAILDLLALPCPTIAAVQGLVTGGAVGLVLACDIAVAGPRASFAPWYTAVGFSPDGGWTALMPERIGRARALDIQLTNRRIEAEEALHIGLVQYRAEEGAVMERTLAVATKICAARPGALSCTLALTRPDIARVEAALAAEYQQFLHQIATDEADLGMKTFLTRNSARTE